ncbi:MAG: hypothetical protein LRY55_13455 [Leadbetterella sp.]|nr:hypothetical protein [Leadbetterella sp.]
MKTKTLPGSYNPSEKYDVEIKMLDSLISKTESSSPKKGSSSDFTLQQMKKRRNAILSAIDNLG